MSTLTERYVHEVVRRIPADQRDDVADELRATIADTVEARDSGDPEREVLTEMGDPIRLAARYADRSLALIGPELYPAYVRLLVVLLSTVLPIVTAVLVVADIFEHNDLGSAVTTGIGAVFTVGAQMVAWTTLVFVLVERRSRQRGRLTREAGGWTPADLPEPPRQDKRGIGVLVSAVLDAVIIGLILWQHTAEPYRTGNANRLQVLDPALWSGWIWPILAGLAGLAVIKMVRIALRGWTIPLLAGYAVAEAVFALPLAWLLYQQKFLNPGLLADQALRGWTMPDAVYTVAALGVLAVSVSNVVKYVRESTSS
jgi:hypothetical protein